MFELGDSPSRHAEAFGELTLVDAEVAALSRGQAKGKFSFLHGARCVVQCFGDVFDFEVRVLGEDLVGGHAVSDHCDDGGDGEAKIADARDAALVCRCGRLLGERCLRGCHALLVRSRRQPTSRSSTEVTRRNGLVERLRNQGSQWACAYGSEFSAAHASIATASRACSVPPTLRPAVSATIHLVDQEPHPVSTAERATVSFRTRSAASSFSRSLASISSRCSAA